MGQGMANPIYLVGICALNEGEKIRRVISKFNDHDRYDVLIIDDGSTDGSLTGEHPPAVTILRNDRPRGAGHGVRQIFQHARERGYQAVLFVSGNDKDDPNDINGLIAALEDGADLVQGSRYLPGGGHGGMPAYRRIATQWVHPGLMSLITGRRVTDSTNGFRGVRMSLLDDPRVNIRQDWLDAYELEPYVLFKALTLGYDVREVPVKKIYPPRAQGYTKMKPLSGWWSILRPLVYLGLRIKR